MPIYENLRGTDDMTGMFKLSAEDEDLRLLKWSHRHGYIGRTTKSSDNPKGQTTESQHRVVMERVLGRPLTHVEVVDHINFDISDNRRENLRVCSSGLNATRKSALNRNNTSGHRGVRWNKKHQSWEAYITVRGVQYYLGLYRDKDDAIAAYMARAQAEFGEFLGAVK